MKVNFIKWFVAFGAMLTASAIAGQQGLFTLIANNDVSYLSSIIGLLFLASSGLAGALAWGIDSRTDNYEVASIPGWAKPKLSILNYFVNLFFALGLLGTIIGFCFVMHNTLQGDDVSLIISQLREGVGTALYTTLVGMCASLGLQLQVFLMEQRVAEIKDDND